MCFLRFKIKKWGIQTINLYLCTFLEVLLLFKWCLMDIFTSEFMSRSFQPHQYLCRGLRCPLSLFLILFSFQSFLQPLYAQGSACTCCWFANYWAPGYLNLPAPPLAARWADRQRVTTGELKSPAFPAVGKLSSALFELTKNKKQDRPS